MFTLKKLKSGKSKKRFVSGTVALLFLVFSSTIVFASVITKDNIKDAILGSKVFTETELKEMDLNKDGKVDVADLIKFFHPSVNFETSVTTVYEGDDKPILLNLTIPHKYTGAIEYSISGTASNGTDFTKLSTSVIGKETETGTSFQIEVNIKDDAEFENIETIVLTIKNGGDYKAGSNNTHIIYIKENDSKWYGTLNADRLLIGFQMNLSEMDGVFVGKVISDGTEGLPKGEWPATITTSADSFNVSFGPIELASKKYLTGVATSRTIELVSNQGTNSEEPIFNKDIITGDMTDIITMSNEHLNTGVIGTFILKKGSEHIEVQEVELENIN
ncbi:MAG: hypothetical protein GY760_12070 [Deltaproteobacteria bacterium]|nr:hypothetical protein [Deltaproteobacteria bacterium]